MFSGIVCRAFSTNGYRKYGTTKHDFVNLSSIKDRIEFFCPDIYSVISQDFRFWIKLPDSFNNLGWQGREAQLTNNGELDDPEINFPISSYISIK